MHHKKQAGIVSMKLCFFEMFYHQKFELATAILISKIFV